MTRGLGRGNNNNHNTNNTNTSNTNNRNKVQPACRLPDIFYCLLSISSTDFNRASSQLRTALASMSEVSNMDEGKIVWLFHYDMITRYNTCVSAYALLSPQPRCKGSVA
jgi:hypothetical protein